ncbi:MAG: tetratricopeptide repeat protein, partial [Candidatus Eremiobacteraeota bacterium]|nr:tetratricopeptide repeat protein [Candidatus Eremiobacteraeota bacterium]
ANTVYPPEVYREALTVMFGLDGYDRILSRHNVDLVLSNKLHIPYDHKIPLLLEKDSEWEKIYEDDISVLFLRKDPFSERAKRPDDGFIYPESYYSLAESGREAIRHGDMKGAEKILIKSLRLRPGYAPAWIDLGVVFGNTGREEEAAKCFKQALELTPAIGVARYNLAKYYKSRGNIKKARKLLEEELRFHPDYKPAIEMLEELSR